MLTYILNWPVVLTYVGSGKFWVMETGMGNPKAVNANQSSFKKTQTTTTKTKQKKTTQTKLYAKVEFGSTADFFLPAPKGEKVSSPV